MKEPLPKGVLIAIVVVAAIALFFGGRAVQKAGEPEVERGSPPPGFYQRATP